MDQPSCKSELQETFPADAAMSGAAPHPDHAGLASDADEPRPDFSLMPPDELWMMIFSFFDQHDLTSIALVCSRFAALVCTHERRLVVIKHPERHLTAEVCQRLAWHRPRALDVGEQHFSLDEDKEFYVGLPIPSISHLSVLHTLERLIVRSKIVNDAQLSAIVTALPALRALELTDCEYLFDQGVLHLSVLTGLKLLQLGFCVYLTDQAVPPIAMLTGLRSVALTASQLTTQGASLLVSSLRALAYLDLCECGVTAFSCPLPPQLRRLNLAYTPLSDAGLETVGTATALTDLNLRGCHQVTDAGFRHLAGLPLKKLNLDATQLTIGALANFGRFISLTDLRLGPTLVTDAGLLHLAPLTRLKTLRLSNTPVTDAGLLHLAPLTRLKTLELDSCEGVTELRHLAGLSRLETLSLSYTQLNDAALAHLSACTSLTDLNLCKTHVTDAGLLFLAPLTRLKTLRLRDCRPVTDLKHLAGLTRLETLDLNETHLSDELLVHVSACTSLTDLDLSVTRVTDAGLLHLAPLTRLKRLMLIWCNDVTEAGMAPFKAREVDVWWAKW